MSIQTVVGLAGQALLVAGAVAALLRRLSPKPGAARYLPVAAAALGLLPLGHLSTAAHLRGQFGDLSVTSMALLALGLLSFLLGRDLLGERSRRALYPALALVALFFYPFALGFTYFDPYGAGYGSYAMLGALAASVLAAWLARQYAIVAIVSLALAAYLVGALESSNLCDYLLDPLTAVYAMAWCALDLPKRRAPA
jgi:hypothetical protein